jgi:hypothetical protein
MTDEEISSAKERSENEHSPSAAIEPMFPGMNVLSKCRYLLKESCCNSIFTNKRRRKPIVRCVLSDDDISNEALVQFARRMEHPENGLVQSAAMEPIFPGKRQSDCTKLRYLARRLNHSAVTNQQQS